MANSWASALGAGLSAFGGIKMKMDDDKEREAAKIAQYEAAAKARRDEFRRTHSLPTINSYKTTGADGQPMERTISSTYDPTSDSFVTEEIGSVHLLSPKERNAQVETFYDETTGMPYKAERADDGSWKRIGGVQSRRAVSGGGDSEKPTKATSLTEAQIDALFSTTNDIGESMRDDDKYRNFVAFQTRNAQKDPKYRDANFAVQQWANQVGFDPNEKPPGTFTMDEVESAPMPDSAKPKKADAPGSSQANPIPATSLKSEPPPGTWVQLPDGRVIQTKG